jgi:hypothetical protein
MPRAVAMLIRSAGPLIEAVPPDFVVQAATMSAMKTIAARPMLT